MTLRGVAFPHLLFEWVLSYSRWTYVELALSETFEALVSGLQGALWTLGAVPAVLRHDNLSAATHELRRSGGRQLTARFRQVLDPYDLLSSRIQPGKPHENGVAEQAHFRTATAIEQALLLRGERDFVDEAAYLCFVRAVVDEERNAPAAARLAEERPYLGPLPSGRVPEYTTFECRVRKWSTIRVGGRVYSVPSRLIGHTVEARQHPSTVEVLYGGRVLCTMPRLRGSAEHRIDYRHIIGSLVRRPTLNRAIAELRNTVWCRFRETSASPRPMFTGILAEIRDPRGVVAAGSRELFEEARNRAGFLHAVNIPPTPEQAGGRGS